MCIATMILIETTQVKDNLFNQIISHLFYDSAIQVSIIRVFIDQLSAHSHDVQIWIS